MTALRDNALAALVVFALGPALLLVVLLASITAEGREIAVGVLRGCGLRMGGAH